MKRKLIFFFWTNGNGNFFVVVVVVDMFDIENVEPSGWIFDNLKFQFQNHNNQKKKCSQFISDLLS